MLREQNTPDLGQVKIPGANNNGPLKIIPEVENLLTDITESGGGVILVGAVTGGGKTILAGQIASHFVGSSRDVTYISTEVEPDELHARMVSAATGWPYKHLVDGKMAIVQTGGIQLLVDSTNSDDFAVQSLQFNRRFMKHLELIECREFPNRPLEALQELLCEIEVPSCLILDLLQFYGLRTNEVTGEQVVIDMAAEATQIMACLSQYACDHRIPVIVCCQLKPDGTDSVRKRVKFGQISEFPIIAEKCDAFIGISCVQSTPGKFEQDGTYSRDQFFCIRKPGDQQMLVPVTREFECQRFASGNERGNTRSKDLEERSRKMRQSSKLPGFVLFRREDFKRLSELGYPPAINVYAAFLLGAKFKAGNDRGTIFWSQDLFAAKLGLSRNQVRAAIKKLEDAELIKDTGFKKGRAKIYKVVDYGKNQDASVQGYFILAHNLRDPERARLLSNASLFRTWLTLIYETRYATDIECLYARGQIPLDLERLSDLSGNPVETLDADIGQLVNEGRAESVEIPFYELQALELVNYDIYQDGASYRNTSRASGGQYHSKVGFSGDQSSKPRGPKGGQWITEMGPTRDQLGTTKEEGEKWVEGKKDKNEKISSFSGKGEGLQPDTFSALERAEPGGCEAALQEAITSRYTSRSFAMPGITN